MPNSGLIDVFLIGRWVFPKIAIVNHLFTLNHGHDRRAGAVRNGRSGVIQQRFFGRSRPLQGWVGCLIPCFCFFVDRIGDFLHFVVICSDEIAQFLADCFCGGVIRILISLLPVFGNIRAGLSGGYAGHDIGTRRVKPQVADRVRRFWLAYENLSLSINGIVDTARRLCFHLFPRATVVDIGFLLGRVVPQITLMLLFQCVRCPRLRRVCALSPRFGFPVYLILNISKSVCVLSLNPVVKRGIISIFISFFPVCSIKISALSRSRTGHNICTGRIEP